MIKVLLVNEQRLINEAIESLLSTEPDISVVGAITDAEEIINQIEAKKPDVILFDIHMSSVDGIKLTVHIKEHYPAVKVIYLTNYSKKELVIAGILAGANGFLLKDIDAESLLHSVRSAYRNQMVISGDAAKILAQQIVELKYELPDILNRKLIHRNVHLSERELEIALLLVDELTNKEIANRLYLSEGTVKNYVSELYSKLQVLTRKEAINYLRELTTVYYK